MYLHRNPDIVLQRAFFDMRRVEEAAKGAVRKTGPHIGNDHAGLIVGRAIVCADYNIFFLPVQRG